MSPRDGDHSHDAHDEREADPAVRVESASPDDATAIARVLASNAHVPTLVLHTPSQLEPHLHEFVVVRGPAGTVVGCARLWWHRPEIAEIASVAVVPSRQGEGLGGALVRACLQRAVPRGPRLVWLATESPGWFERLGFVRMSMWTVPLPVLLGRLPSVLRQPPRRWWGAVLGDHAFMRHAPVAEGS